ncbi:MAG: CehA/McbA family metallohydrolase [Planctomycetota bacterium]|nr:CehA/McbA family metallohydrolase [Planctomycetota bacterium]
MPELTPNRFSRLTGLVFLVAPLLLLLPREGKFACSQEKGQLPKQTAPAIDEVELQPLVANVRRLLQALEAIGEPVSPTRRKKIEAFIEQGDLPGLQQGLQPLVDLSLRVSANGKISGHPAGPGLSLFRTGFKPLIFRVENRSGKRFELQAFSPNAGAVYSGTSQFSLQRQQQTELGKAQNADGSTNRYLDIEVYTRSPMKRNLSGLSVEYGICLVQSLRSGHLQPRVGFRVVRESKEGEENEQPELFPLELHVQEAIPVEFRIIDPSQQSRHPIAKLVIRDQQGRVYPNQPKRLAPDLFFQPQIYRRSGEKIFLKPGTYQVRYSRGPEYRLLQKSFQVRSGSPNLWELKLKRWFDAAGFGYYSGDHHIHAAGCSHYALPTQGVRPRDMYRQVTGEGLNVGCILTWGPCFDFQRKFFDPAPLSFENRETLIKYDIEVSGFGSQALGHVCLLNLENQTYPESGGTKNKGWPTWTTPVMKWAKKQGGYTGYAHSASGLAIDPIQASRRLLAALDQNEDGHLSKDECHSQLLPLPFAKIDTNANRLLSPDELINSHRKSAEQLPNYSIPEMNGVGAMEICVSAVHGVCDFISAMDTARIQEWNTWYHLLNCGFPIKVSGETDFPCMSSRRVGKGRVYVDLGKELPLGQSPDFETWCRHLALGRSYVSDGFAHIPEFTVGGTSPGHKPVQLKRAGTVKVRFQVAFAPQTPESVAQGTQSGTIARSLIGDTVELHHPREHEWIQGGTRKIEIVVNGQVVANRTVEADGQLHPFELDVPISQSSWVAVRQFPQLHSNPVEVLVDRQPIRASRRSARWCEKMTELLWINRQRTISPEERPAAAAAFAHTLERLREIAVQCQIE